MTGTSDRHGDHCIHGACIMAGDPRIADCRDCDGYNPPFDGEGWHYEALGR